LEGTVHSWRAKGQEVDCERKRGTGNEHVVEVAAGGAFDIEREEESNRARPTIDVLLRAFDQLLRQSDRRALFVGGEGRDDDEFLLPVHEGRIYSDSERSGSALEFHHGGFTARRRRLRDVFRSASHK